MASQYRMNEAAGFLGLVHVADHGLCVMALSRQATPLLLDESECRSLLPSERDDAQPFLHSDSL